MSLVPFIIHSAASIYLSTCSSFGRGPVMNCPDSQLAATVLMSRACERNPRPLEEAGGKQTAADRTAPAALSPALQAQRWESQTLLRERAGRWHDVRALSLSRTSRKKSSLVRSKGPQTFEQTDICSHVSVSAFCNMLFIVSFFSYFITVCCLLAIHPFGRTPQYDEATGFFPMNPMERLKCLK